MKDVEIRHFLNSKGAHNLVRVMGATVKTDVVMMMMTTMGKEEEERTEEDIIDTNHITITELTSSHALFSF